MVALAAAMTAGACNRGPTEESAMPDTAADAREEHREQAAEIEQRMTELEREWNEVQSTVTAGTQETAAEARAEIQEELADARQALGNLQTTTAANWWERTEREIEQEMEELEGDVRRFARDWDAPEPAGEVGTAGSAETTWEGRRDRLVSRMEARLESMERALENATADGEEADELEETRARVREMRDETGQLRDAAEDDWWDITRARVNNAIDRIDRSIERFGDRG
jgi:DNA repair exonuclease SbcCD ATPase subunit